MFRLIVGVLILVLLGVLFAMNVANVTDLNLFGSRMRNVPIIAVAIAGFVLGVLYSYIHYFLRYLARQRRASQKNRDRSVRDRERTLKDREKELKTLAEGVKDKRAAGKGTPDPDAGEPPAGRRRRAR